MPTNTVRILLAGLTAWLLPSYAVLAVTWAEDRLVHGAEGLVARMLGPSMVLFAPLLGLGMGWASLLFGATAWAILHATGRVRPAYAALVGAVAPLLPLGDMQISSRNTEPVVSIPLGLTIVAIGALTGLAVWRIAYPPHATLADPRHP